MEEEDIILDPLDVKILMELQYRFPFSEKPFDEVAQRLGVEPAEIMNRVRGYRDKGILKRIGFHVNYRSFHLSAALVGYRVSPQGVETLEQLVSADPSVTHAYLRDHPQYNAWIVIRKPGMSEVERHALILAERIEAEDHLVLQGIKTYKLSVKYDLHKGISWSSEKGALRQVSQADLAILSGETLASLKYLPLVRKPFHVLAQRLGMNAEGLMELVRGMLARGALAGPSASLDGEKLGFRHNAMIAAACTECCSQAAEIPETTHVVLRRSVKDKWRHPCFMMIHSSSRRKAEETVERVSETLGNPSLQVLYSLRNLKPGVIR